MRIVREFLGLSWLAAVCAFGQVTVEVLLEQHQFLPGESLPIAVHITNLSGQTLALGEDDDWLRLAVESNDSYVIRRLGYPQVQGAFALESSHRAIKRLDLAPCFDLSRQGGYVIRATVNIAQWNRQFTSESVPFNIITGARLWECQFGVPQRDTNSAPEVRKYVLQEANYLKKDLRLYVRLTDANEANTFRVVGLGPSVSFGKPEPRLDRLSNLHLLFQRGRTTCAYVVVDPEGNVLVRQTYAISGSRPRLRVDEEGRIAVIGGMRRYTDEDYPPREMPTIRVGDLPNSGDAVTPAPSAANTNEVGASRP